MKLGGQFQKHFCGSSGYRIIPKIVNLSDYATEICARATVRRV